MADDHDSLAQKAASEAAVNEKCVVAQFRTTPEQREVFATHLASCNSEAIPVEWVIDVADESNGWFYGTAYHFNDRTQMLHIMVPDKVNPSFDGNVQLDHRMVHLVECVDGKTEALFNKIIRDSITKVKWEVEWFEEGPGDTKFDGDSEVVGRWISSVARYYLRIANQILVEDVEGPNGGVSHGFVMLTADLSLKLKECVGGRGLEDFNRLVMDGQVQSSKATHEKAIISASKLRSMDSQDGAEGSTPLRKLADMSRSLRESIAILLEEREKLQSDKKTLIAGFTSFALDGDIDAALKLMSLVDEYKSPVHQQIQEEWEIANEDAWYLCQRVEKSALKLFRAGDPASAAAEEMEQMRKQLKALKKDLLIKESEIEVLRAQLR